MIDNASHEKDSRLNFRVTSSQHHLLRSAAALAGSSVSEFVVRPAIERAHQILAAEAVTRIDPDHVSDFEAWLDAPDAIIPEMVRLADAEPFD